MEADGVFEGGGMKGIALVGALRRAKEEGVVFKRVAGTSAGAIVASLYAAGYSADELWDVFHTTDFNPFRDSRLGTGKWWLNPLLLPRILFYYGIHSGNYFYGWIREQLARKRVVQFKDLKLPLKVVASDITHKRMLVFESDLHPEMEVAQAVRMSMGIPLFFYAYRWSDPALSGRKSLVIDGGLLSSYPIHIFDDHERQTIGFMLIGPEETHPPEPITNILSYGRSILNTMMVAHERIHVAEAAWAKTIRIPTGAITATKFELTAQDKVWLYESGYEAADRFFKASKISVVFKGRTDTAC